MTLERIQKRERERERIGMIGREETEKQQVTGPSDTEPVTK